LYGGRLLLQELLQFLKLFCRGLLLQDPPHQFRLTGRTALDILEPLFGVFRPLFRQGPFGIQFLEGEEAPAVGVEDRQFGA
jgi:hypothetical protein